MNKNKMEKEIDKALDMMELQFYRQGCPLNENDKFVARVALKLGYTSGWYDNQAETNKELKDILSRHS